MSGDLVCSPKGKIQPTSPTAIQLHPHWYLAVPSLWSKADVACSDWGIKFMVDNSVLVCISSKNLHQRYGIFWSIILKISTYKLEVDAPLYLQCIFCAMFYTRKSTVRSIPLFHRLPSLIRDCCCYCCYTILSLDFTSSWSFKRILTLFVRRPGSV